MLQAERLQKRWDELLKQMGCHEKQSKCLTRLTDAYDEDWRAYHTMAHIEVCLDELDSVLPLAEDPYALEFALWFHDSIYEIGATDNEARSADWAAQVLREEGISSATIGRVRDFILATKHTERPTLPDACLMADIDLAILGYPTPQFDRYEIQIRQEYQQIPDELFRPGRVLILESFLKRETLYYTAFFQEKYETKARANLARSIATLQKSL